MPRRRPTAGNPTGTPPVERDPLAEGAMNLGVTLAMLALWAIYALIAIAVVLWAWRMVTGG